MNKSQRMIELMMLVNKKQQFTARELAEECGVSVRTILRDLRHLEELGVPLYTEYGRNGGFRLLKEKLLPPLSFLEEEAFAIFFAVQLLQEYKTIPFGKEAMQALSKFYQVLPAATQKQIDAMQRCVRFWVPPREQDIPHLQHLLHASLDKRTLQIRYASTRRVEMREIVPIGLYAHNGYWYCPAYCMKRRGYRLFRADCMLEVAEVERIHTDVPINLLTLEEWFEPPQHKDGSVHVPLRVELTKLGVRKCQADPWLDKAMTVREEGTGFIHMDIAGSEISYLADILFGMGTDAYVLEPMEIVTIIHQKAEQVVAHYRGNKS
ncbi:helix-turn-helix transcriptional regulator [Paenibacillus sp. B1-33]|uniref:helix-turn-helix transcriptional regulator n=1 Tax=unclassified Paenibacillus TaxID=185978 RepID=UPI003D2A69BA